jgi:hypothetical protein
MKLRRELPDGLPRQVNGYRAGMALKGKRNPTPAARDQPGGMHPKLLLLAVLQPDGGVAQRQTTVSF